VGLGGRQQRTDPKWGHIFDHFSIVYDFASGAKVFLSCRQMKNCANQTFDHVIGTEGAAVLNADGLEGMSEHSITGAKPWSWPEKHDFGAMYQNEHNALFAAIRKGIILNNIESAALSTQMAIMGRLAGYTGKKLTWKQIMESKENLMPEKLEMGSIATAPVAIPGVTKFV
jgi:hypothetical protein